MQRQIFYRLSFKENVFIEIQPSTVELDLNTHNAIYYKNTHKHLN